MGRTKNLRDRLDGLGAHWSEEATYEVVEHYGDPRGEYDAVGDGGLAIVERGERETLVVYGPDAIPWLQGLVTGDLHELVDEGNGQRNAWVNTTGRFVGEARLLHLPELLFFDLEAGTLGNGLMSHLRRHIILEDVTLDDRSDASARITLVGEPAAAALEELAEWQHDIAERPPFFGTWGRWKGEDLILQRQVWSDLPCFDVTCDVAAAEALIEALRQLDDGAVMMGRQAFEILRIEAGVPRFGVELHEKVIPLEAAFDDAVAYDKGCYLGQEIIARLDTLGTPAKLLRRVILEGDDVPEPETEVFPADGKGRKIGHVESAVMSPRFDAPLALAFVKRGHNDVGAQVRIGEAKGRLEALKQIGAPDSE